MDEYPRMLYRPAKGAGNMVWNERVDTLVVNSIEEERLATKENWVRDPSAACKISAKWRKRSAMFAWFRSHWQFWITTSIAIAALIVTILALHKAP
jgi:hypothetical protein